MLIQHTAPAECKDLVQIAWRFSNGEETALVWWRWTLVGVCQTKPKAVDCFQIVQKLFKGPPPSLLGIPLRGWEGLLQ